MKILKTILFCGLFAFFAIQETVANSNSDVVWERGFDGRGFRSVTTVPSGIIAVGSALDSHFGRGDWEGVIGSGAAMEGPIIVKFDHNSEMIWRRYFSAAAKMWLGGSSWFSSVTTVPDGVVAVGTVALGFAVPGRGSSDAIIAKFDLNGDVVWERNFGGAHNDGFSSVVAVTDGIIAVGSSQDVSFGNGDWIGVTSRGRESDATIVKFDLSGNVVWKRNFGGAGWSSFRSVTIVPDGIIAVGQAQGNVFGTGDWIGITGRGDEDAIIVKFDHNGDVIWKRNFGGDQQGGGYHETEIFHSVTAVPDGIIAVGRAQGNVFGTSDWLNVTRKGWYDAIIVKFDHSGDIVWRRNFGGAASDRFRSVTAISDGVIVVGYSIEQSFGTGDWEGFTGRGMSDAIIVRFDHDGNVVRKRNFGGVGIDQFHSIIAIPDRVIAVGEYEYQVGIGMRRRSSIVKFDINVHDIYVSANPPKGGTVSGGSMDIKHGTSVTVSATANECWTFANWTINGEVVSTQNPFTFSATETAHLVANFDGPILDFDTYASTLWNNTFMLNLNRLRADGFEALDACWFRNGIEIIDTRTGSAFSYSAGPNASDLLQLAPTFYHFEISTERCGVVPSTPKTITSHRATVGVENFRPLHAFPNPIQSGGTVTLENTTAGHQIQIFNRSGMLVKSAVATDGTTLLTLNIPQGIYVIHVDNNTVQILVTE